MDKQERRKIFLDLVEHPNDDSGNKFYLHEIKTAAKLLERTRHIKGFGQSAYGTAQMLRQLHKRIEDELKR